MLHLHSTSICTSTPTPVNLAFPYPLPSYPAHARRQTHTDGVLQCMYRRSIGERSCLRHQGSISQCHGEWRNLRLLSLFSSILARMTCSSKDHFFLRCRPEPAHPPIVPSGALPWMQQPGTSHRKAAPADREKKKTRSLLNKNADLMTISNTENGNGELRIHFRQRWVRPGADVSLHGK